MLSLTINDRKKKTKQNCTGSSDLFIYKNIGSSRHLKHLKINERTKFNSLGLENNEVLLLQNNNISQSVQRSSGFIVAYKTSASAEWSLGVTLCQTVCFTGLSNAQINDKVSCAKISLLI